MENDDKYYAHSENNLGEKHGLLEHLQQTSQIAQFSTYQEQFKTIFKLTGLLHDLGKYQPEFQSYLVNGGKRGSVPHASWGAGYARLNRLIEPSIVIDGHHKGLPNNSVWKNDTEPFKRREVPGFEDAVERFLHDYGNVETDLKLPESMEFANSLQREAFIRYLFSALTDADWLSTEQHFEKDKYNTRKSAILQADLLINNLDQEFIKKSKIGEINQLRNDARNQVLQKAGTACGFYSLALPTGMGKTLISVAWALRHAKENKLKRIILVLPYVNIIDQTAQVLKNIFGEEQVLEHHSGFNEDAKAGTLPDQERRQLACENWDYPIIVTTTVQFFESLFSNSPGQCRKVHNIAESVVIFDEVQTLPKEEILPTLQMLKDIQEVMKVSFLFCTATQPAFEKRPGFDGINNIHPLIKNPGILYDKTRRVEYLLLNGLEKIEYNELLKSVLQTETAALVIFNTKKATLEFFNCANNSGSWERKYHLSTAMCPAHRKEVIQNIRKDLDDKKKILVSSTQLIEAGVDFDFPVVFRAIAPLESIIQSAGRCNRENSLGNNGGKVFLFKLQDNGMPDKTYAACAGYTEELIKQDISQLHRYNIFNEYYARIIQLYVDPDKYNINEARKRFDFETVNDAYHIIRNSTEGLFIYNYNDDSKQLMHSI
jgi:CRISPR-associated endonuclease/helicase Cas3